MLGNLSYSNFIYFNDLYLPRNKKYWYLRVGNN